jgi:hypothetical protein
MVEKGSMGHESKSSKARETSSVPSLRERMDALNMCGGLTPTSGAGVVDDTDECVKNGISFGILSANGPMKGSPSSIPTSPASQPEA